MARRLTISHSAYLSIEKIVAFNNERNQSDAYSIKFIKGLYKQFKNLVHNPDLGIKIGKSPALVLVWDQFYIFYEKEENHIKILAVRHQKENI